ncbi:glycosyltransferase family 4 protein [Streptococcus gordonii]|uniref:glycosyltransferase family 4 protein n=1 Tax=Streptococcus gordonii TaxID=1302 RepID=UPI000DA2FA3C|nr:glycosyltransferase family 4 protein [Streptococcus gordonii]QXA18976.1 glycosyltransferase family 4 protein [Streptococcus gordonii]SQG05002.1 glycosyl transferase family protein [Streptococcus gordonii]
MQKILYLHAGAEMYGADKVLLELIKELDKELFEAHVILPNDGVLISALEAVGAKVSVLDYPILRRKYFNPKGIFEYFRSYNRFSKEIAKYAQDNGISLLHNNTTAVLEGIYVKRKLKLPLIWHVHEIIVKPKAISDFINLLMGRYADKIVTVSNAVANHVKQSRFVKEDQVRVIYNGVDNAVYHPMQADAVREKFGIQQDSLVIGMIGRVNAWKGQGDFLEAVTPILKANPKAVAFLAGSAFEGEEWRVDELEKSISDSPVAGQIKRIDYYSKTTELYNMFDIFVLPSTNPDPLPTVVLEAMACGKPIVGYRHGGVCEMVAEGINGLLATPNQPAELSKVIQELVENQEKRNQFGQASVERQRELFSLESYIKNFSELYKTDRKD